MKTVRKNELKGSTALSGYVADSFQTFDQATIDSAGAFLVGELERLDPMIHEPLVAYTWSRDIDLRTDVQIGDESCSFTRSTFGMGGTPANGVNWASKDQTAIPRTTIDIGKFVSPLDLLTYEVAYTIPELKSAELTGRPIDSQMLTGMNLKHQMDMDQLVYIGDSNVSGSTGLVNSDTVITNVANVATGAGGGLTWASKSPEEILADVNELLVSVWAATGYAEPPTKLLIAPGPFGYITSQVLSIGGVGAGVETIYSFLQRKNVMTAEKGIELDIKAVKWLDHTYRGVSTDRMFAYNQQYKYVRFPMVPLQPVQPQPRGIWIAVPYYGRAAHGPEWVYTEVAGARDGI